jgi:hypothetical protein
MFGLLDSGQSAVVLGTVRSVFLSSFRDDVQETAGRVYEEGASSDRPSSACLRWRLLADAA